MRGRNTTLLKRRGEMVRKPLGKCHDGIGTLDWVEVLSGKDLKGRRMRFIHDSSILPGASIGVHVHNDDEEYYYIISGKGIMTLNNKRIKVSAGDVTAVFPGGKHGLKNTGRTGLRVIVISVTSM